MRIYRNITKKPYIPPIIQMEEIEEDGALMEGPHSATGEVEDVTEDPNNPGTGGGNIDLAKQSFIFEIEEDIDIEY